MQSAPAVPLEWRTARGHLRLERPAVVGILNVTPDSFWDGGRHAGVAAAVAHAARLLADGADVLDIGGESTRPGAAAVTPSLEIQRVVPVIEAVLQRWPHALLSVDTVKAEVALAAVEAGAAIINDVSGLRLDPALARVAAHAGAGVIIMHSRGGVDDMARYDHAEYGADVAADVLAELEQGLARAHDAGVSDDAIVIDPGLGFAKRTADSLAVLAATERFVALGYPVMVGPSRKRFIGEAVGGLPADARLEGTIAACVLALLQGARLFRVHDVAAVRRALDFTAAVHAS